MSTSKKSGGESTRRGTPPVGKRRRMLVARVGAPPRPTWDAARRDTDGNLARLRSADGRHIDDPRSFLVRQNANWARPDLGSGRRDSEVRAALKWERVWERNAAKLTSTA